MSQNQLKLENKYWSINIQKNESNGFFYILKDKLNDIVYADQDYHYRIQMSKKRGSRYSYLPNIGVERNARQLESRDIYFEDDKTLIIGGTFRNTELQIKHKFYLKENDRWLSEFISLCNPSSKDIKVNYINFGFKKLLFNQFQGWIDNLDDMELTSIPSRRFSGYGRDRKKEIFSASDLLYDAWVFNEGELPGFCAEGWVWSNSQNGIMLCKYNPSQVEFSRFKVITTKLPGRGAEDVSIIYGGAFLCKGNPELATILKPNQTYQFGVSKYISFKGDYKEGYYLYRKHLEECGHRYSLNYNPPIHWNELYNLGWKAEKNGFFALNSEFNLYTLEQLYEEASLAKDIGAECLYLDPGWNTHLGSEIWNQKRFGPLKVFSEYIHDKYELKLGLHLMMNFEGETEPDEFYLRSQKGVRVVSDPYLGLYCVCANDYWVKEKSRRLLDLAKNGIDFFMFDFADFSMFMVNELGCFNKAHGHEVLMRRQTHAENILKVIQNVKKEYPNILVEAHPRGFNHPLYYQHNLPNSFDEKWGFECMWNPMRDLLSGRAIQLFEYNLAYSIPLYLHINENSDNENMLQFWWYASLARHLGIGGVKSKDSIKYGALKNAMVLYKKIKLYFIQGTFWGLNQNLHLHINERKKTGVITAYNLTSRNQKIEINFDPSKFRLEARDIELYNGINQSMAPLNSLQITKNSIVCEIEIPALSPAIALLK